MAQITLADGVVSSNFAVRAGEWVTVVPVAPASVLVEYTTGSAADIAASVAVWREAFPATTNSFIFKNDDDVCFIYVRITATGAAGTYEITGLEFNEAEQLLVRNYERYVINSSYNQAVTTKGKFVLLEDFEGTWAIGDAGPADRWSTTKGSAASAAAATTVAASLCGEVTLTSASDDVSDANNTSTFTSIGLAYKANQGGLAVEARIKLDVVATAYLFVGFTDTISTTLECPIFLVAADIDSTATNACGVCYDTDGTTKQFFHGGVKADADTVPAYSGGAPTAGTYFTVRVEVSATGAVQGFINGKAIGSAVANAVTATTALTPAIFVGNRTAAQIIATIDYIKVEMDRV